MVLQEYSKDFLYLFVLDLGGSFDIFKRQADHEEMVMVHVWIEI
jgi:hypothetical protein